MVTEQRAQPAAIRGDMETSRSSRRPVKPLGGTDGVLGSRSETCFSTWTPLTNRSSGLQLFEERLKLVLHWFDLWTDRQRKRLLSSLLARCTASQLTSCRDVLLQTLPVPQADFTAALPRFLSLYVMSFLTPRDLCAAAQVSWHWRFLAEQDCLWAGRCVSRGWFLPYSPGDREHGAWKSHYVSCVSALDWLRPQQAAERYGTLKEEEERKRRQRLSMRTRRPQRDRLLSGVPLSASPSVCPSGTRGQASSLSSSRASSLLLLISSRVPAYELLLSAVETGVDAVLYDHRGTLSALLAQVERAVSGRRVQRLGLLAPGGTEEVQLLHGSSLSQRTLLSHALTEFWVNLGGWVEPKEEGGGIDVFCPLAASEAGLSLIRTISALTGLEVQAPMGFATGSFQNILSQWSDGSVCGPSSLQPASPALRFIGAAALQGWCRQAQWVDEALQELRGRLGPQLQQVGLQARGRALGHFVWEELRLQEAVTEEREGGGGAEDVSQRSLEQAAVDWRGAAAAELLHSERLYLQRLRSVLEVYQEPLAAALNSSRAVLSRADLHLILSPVEQLLELHRVFEAELRGRLQQWGAETCVGDVLVKLCSKVKVHSSYASNYAAALRAVDQCRETKPSFRAFLKRADRTAATHMLSLQELLLCPVGRMEEYVTLLQALCSHTRPDHPDRSALSSALGVLLGFRGFVQKLKRHSEGDELMAQTQQMIRGCPTLSEGSRRLMLTQDAALLQSPDEDVPESLRAFEHVSDVGLFLFSDALVLTRRSVRHRPFTLARRSSHAFLASVSLCSLAAREITHSRYVSHAFVLEGPRRSWVCATETGEEREHFLSALRSAASAALTEHQ